MKKKSLSRVIKVQTEKTVKVLAFLFFLGLISIQKVSSHNPELLSIQQNSNITVKGKIVDETKEPLIGVVITEKGKDGGTITDIDGNYSLETKVGKVLIFSYIGYEKQEITVKEGTLNVTMNNTSQMLSDVVVVGFGTQKKVNLTGAIGMTDSKALESRPITNISQGLQGLVPGLQVGVSSGLLNKEASINVRGTGTIGQGSSGGPLILIDGMEGDINSLNPQDVDNISILKDAAASSIYGSRAPFGVILITTKTGSQGKTKVNYNNNFRWSSPINMPELLDSYSFATYYNEALLNNGSNARFNDATMQRIKDFQNGTLKQPVPIKPDGKDWEDMWSQGNANTDWYGIMFNDWVLSQEHNISFSGGTNKMNYYVSGNFMDQSGLIKLNEDKFKRLSANAKFSVELAKWARLNVNSRFINTKYGRPSRMADDFFESFPRAAWPTVPAYDENGHAYGNWLVQIQDGGRATTRTNYLYEQVGLVLVPIKNWKTHIDLNYNSKREDWHETKYYTYSYNPLEQPVYRTNDSGIRESMKKTDYINLNAYSEYSFSLKKDHNFKVMGGFQIEQNKYHILSAGRQGIIVSGLDEIDVTSGLSYNGSTTNPTVGGSSSNWATTGFFGRLNYDYKGRYLAEVNLRYDGSSRFRKNERWNIFPSFSAGWNIAREDFWKPLESTVNTLKIRASYGELGNQNTNSNYPTYQIMDVLASSGTWLQDGKKTNIAKVPGLISSSLTWERIKNWNLGLDWGLLNNRLTGSFDYFERKTTDMVGPAPTLPEILGIAVPRTNNTDLKTYGFDLVVAWQDRLKNGINYSARFVLSDAQTKILNYPNPNLNIGTYTSGRLTGEIWGYETIGIAKSQEEMDAHLATLNNGGQDKIGSKWAAGDIMYRDLNGDGKIDPGSNKYDDHGDLKIIGNNTPRYLFGIDLGADWKGVDLRVFFQGVMKRDYWATTNNSYFWGANVENIWYATGLKQHLDYFRSESYNDLAANLDSYYPRPLMGNRKNAQTQTRYLQDASYIRLKNLQIGYTIPMSLTRRIGVDKLRVFFSGENLWTGTKLSDVLDPETIDGGNTKSGYSTVNGQAYPLSKTISFGINVTL